jgi:hypothetical protein
MSEAELQNYILFSRKQDNGLLKFRCSRHVKTSHLRNMEKLTKLMLIWNVKQF